MQVVKTKTQLRAALQPHRREGRSVGFVPTMGYLHDGHLALVQRARRENDVVAVSIFVNPTQFGPNEDLAAYPRDLERDLALLEQAGTDIVFCPAVEELYPPGYMTYVHIEGAITGTLCGRSRPGHFRGVATIVSKLFHLVMPRRAYFGQKDAQQVAVIQQMVRDLDFDLEVVPCATVREADGLALSSRNTFLTAAQRARAPMIHQALQDARSTIAAGERRAVKVVERIKDRLAAMDDSTIDYVSIVDARTLVDLDTVGGEVLIAVAIRVGRTRLIDNIRVQV